MSRKLGYKPPDQDVGPRSLVVAVVYTYASSYGMLHRSHASVASMPPDLFSETWAEYCFRLPFVLATDEGRPPRFLDGIFLDINITSFPDVAWYLRVGLQSEDKTSPGKRRAILAELRAELCCPISDKIDDHMMFWNCSVPTSRPLIIMIMQQSMLLLGSHLSLEATPHPNENAG